MQQVVLASSSLHSSLYLLILLLVLLDKTSFFSLECILSHCDFFAGHAGVCRYRLNYTSTACCHPIHNIVYHSL